jgi:hypothetical protein
MNVILKVMAVVFAVNLGADNAQVLAFMQSHPTNGGIVMAAVIIGLLINCDVTVRNEIKQENV